MGRGRRHAVMKAMPRTCIDLPDDFPFLFCLLYGLVRVLRFSFEAWFTGRKVVSWRIRGFISWAMNNTIFRLFLQVND